MGHFADTCTAPPRSQQGTTNLQTQSQSQTQTQTQTSQSNETNSQGGNQEQDQDDQEQCQAVGFFCHHISLQGGPTDSFLKHLKEQILLDNQSTADIFCNKAYLKDIHEVPETLKLHTNGGTLLCNEKGTLEGYGEVWYHKNAIANIISLNEVKAKGRYRITYDSEDGQGFKMTNKETNKVTVFKEHTTGLHTTPLDAKVAMLNTVEENKCMYSKRQVARAEEARNLYHVIGYPSVRDFKHIIQTNQLKNCPVTVEYINNSEKIFGPDVYALKGKSTRKKPKVVVNDYVEIPRELIEAHQGVEICADIIFIDKVPMLVTLSKNIRFITLARIHSRQENRNIIKGF